GDRTRGAGSGNRHRQLIRSGLGARRDRDVEVVGDLAPALPATGWKVGGPELVVALVDHRAVGVKQANRGDLVRGDRMVHVPVEARGERIAGAKRAGVEIVTVEGQGAK